MITGTLFLLLVSLKEFISIHTRVYSSMADARSSWQQNRPHLIVLWHGLAPQLLLAGPV